MHFTTPCNAEWEQCVINVVVVFKPFVFKCPVLEVHFAIHMHNINRNESEHFILCYLYCPCKVTVDRIEKHSKWQFPISHNPKVPQMLLTHSYLLARHL